MEKVIYSTYAKTLLHIGDGSQYVSMHMEDFQEWEYEV